MLMFSVASSDEKGMAGLILTESLYEQMLIRP